MLVFRGICSNCVFLLEKGVLYQIGEVTRITFMDCVDVLLGGYRNTPCPRCEIHSDFLRLFQLLSRATDTEQISPKG